MWRWHILSSRVRRRNVEGLRFRPRVPVPKAEAGCRRMASDTEFATVTGRIDKQQVKELMIALAQVPSPLTDLLEAEPQLRAFIDTAVEPRLRAMGVTDIVRDRMGNLA